MGSYGNDDRNERRPRGRDPFAFGSLLEDDVQRPGAGL